MRRLKEINITAASTNNADLCKTLVCQYTYLVTNDQKFPIQLVLLFITIELKDNLKVEYLLHFQATVKKLFLAKLLSKTSHPIIPTARRQNAVVTSVHLAVDRCRLAFTP